MSWSVLRRSALKYAFCAACFETPTTRPIVFDQIVESTRFNFGLRLVLVLIALFGWFVTVFTRRLKADTAAEYNEITPMVRFCYFSPFWPSHWPSHRHLWFDFCPSLLTEPSCGVRLE